MQNLGLSSALPLATELIRLHVFYSIGGSNDSSSEGEIFQGTGISDLMLASPGNRVALLRSIEASARLHKQLFPTVWTSLLEVSTTLSPCIKQLVERLEDVSTDSITQNLHLSGMALSLTLSPHPPVEFERAVQQAASVNDHFTSAITSIL